MTPQPGDDSGLPAAPGSGDEPTPPRRRRRRLRRVLVALGLVLVLLVVGALVYVRSTPFGASASGDRLARIEGSPHWHDGEFTAPQPLWVDGWDATIGSISGSETSSPGEALDIAPTDTRLFDVPPVTGLRITWFGHSSTLVEIDGSRVLVDPFWGEQSGPSSLLGIKPFYRPPAALSEIGPVDVVLISHDHWDHLDQPTISAMTGWRDTTFVVPLGTGAHLERWGIAAERIRELDWWQSETVGPVQFTSTPARHNSGRNPLHSNEALWSGWALRGPRHRAWYSGDTGYFAGLEQIGERLGPFDVTLIGAGQYDPSWPDNHLGPELALEANAMVGGKLVIPVHWGLFDLAPHSWTEPVERVRAEARCRDQSYLALVPGAPTEPTGEAVAAQRQWWPELPWRTAGEALINPTVQGNPDQRVDIKPCVLGGR